MYTRILAIALVSALCACNRPTASVSPSATPSLSPSTPVNSNGNSSNGTPSAAPTSPEATVAADINPTLETNDAVVAEVQALQELELISDVLIRESFPVQISLKGSSKIVDHLKMAASGSQLKPAVFRSLMQRNSRIEEAGTHVLKDSSAYADFWLKYNGASSNQPAVDFNKEVAVAVLSGQKTTGGYRTVISGTYMQGSTLVVTYVETAPDPNGLVTQIITSPSHLVAVELAASSFQAVEFKALN